MFVSAVRTHSLFIVVLLVAALASATVLAEPEERFGLVPLDASGLIPYFIADGAERSQFGLVTVNWRCGSRRVATQRRRHAAI